MDLIDQLRQIAHGIPDQVKHIQTEEATKNALTLPFISALGYNVFDPREVVPEYTADVGIKKGEKIDYAIMKDGAPIILIECKWCGADLDSNHSSQLFRYFSTTPTRIAILTNGIAYRFFADLDEPNKMDERPFFEFNMLDISEQIVRELKRFTKAVFDIEGIIPSASELKYTREIKRLLSDQMVNTDPDFVKFFAGKVYSGKLTQPVKDRFNEIVKKAMSQFVSDRVSDRLKSALAEENATFSPKPANAQEGQQLETDGTDDASSKIVTTEEEKEAFFIVKAILRGTVDTQKIAMRDTASYCGVLFDDNNRKPVCRFIFSPTSKRLILFDEARKEIKVNLSSLDEIYDHGEQIMETVKFYLNQQK